MSSTKRPPLYLLLALLIGGIWFAFEPAQGEHRRSDDQRNGGNNSTVEHGVETVSPLSKTEVIQAFGIYKNTCAACHGGNLEGASGPSLVGVGSRYSLDKIEKIAQFGKGKQKQVSMPPGLVTAEEATLLARWLATNPN